MLKMKAIVTAIKYAIATGAVFLASKKNDKETDLSTLVIDTLKRCGPLKATDIAKKINRSSPSVVQSLCYLESKGEVTRTGKIKQANVWSVA